MSVGISFVKYVLFIFNIITAVIGLALLGLSVTARLEIITNNDLAGSPIEMAINVFIVVGAIAFIVSFYGCCGAIKESNCMLVAYAVFLVVLIILEVVLAAGVLVFLDEIKHVVAKLLEQIFKENYDVLTDMQENFKCCGTTGPVSYSATTLPESCCPTKVFGTCTALNAYNTGCIDVLTEYLTNIGRHLGRTVIVIATVKVVGVIFSLSLANFARKMEKSVQRVFKGNQYSSQQNLIF